MSAIPFSDLNTLATYLRQELEDKKFILLYAYNGTGKTRLSTAFKDLGKNGEARDTLYFNAFTEDLFYWDNDLDNDRERVLKINSISRFFAGLEEMEMDNRIRPLLDRYADFDFKIDTNKWEVSFSRQFTRGEGENAKTETVDDIKVSRGEENIFIWCFFLAIVQLVLDGAEAYKWVKYIYIDDPISSLDENNAIAVANHFAQMLTKTDSGPKTVISSHHVLFFNVLCNELKKKAHRYFLQNGAKTHGYLLLDTTSKPFLHHLATLVDLNDVQKSGALYTHHFNMMRRVMEQTANFFGLSDWKDCIKAEEDDPDKTLYKRIIDLMSHGDYSLYEPKEMMEENKNHFRKIFYQFISRHPFNPTLFPSDSK
ncbi:MAG TPA: AAA family ATPase [Pyrinomonadaceae bacterium]|nr:AAA family ATPase [Pyrinomonadaceae bacterium]